MLDNRRPIRIVGDGKTDWATYDGLNWLQIDLKCDEDYTEPQSNIFPLIDYGFTSDEAKAFLEQEPSYKGIRRNVPEEESDGDVPEPPC